MKRFASAFGPVTLLIAGLLVSPLFAQSESDLDLIKQLGGDKKPDKKKVDDKNKDPRNIAPSGDKNSTMDAKTRLRIQAAEIFSGARAKANRTPLTEQIVGPPMNAREKAYHILNRAAFGARPGMVDELERSGWEAWLEEQLDPDSIDDSKVEKMLAEKFPLLTKSMGAMESHMIENCTRDTPGCDRPGCPSKKDLYSQLPQKVMMRAALSERQLKQVVAEFWRNHFSVNQRLQSNKMCFSTVDWEENVIQKHSMGKFRDLLLASAHHPTMLEYLDNWLSKNGAHNENYARELMELHTLGVDSYYNESDVLELTKALTGWQFKWDRNAKNGRSLVYYFNTSHHNGAPKKLLGRPISGGYKGGIYAVSMLAAHPGTANYISYKLCRYFVNDNPPPAMVRRIASVFRASNGDLPKVYKAILTSPEFWNRKNYRAKFKTPFEFAVSSLRVTNAKIDNAHTAASFLDLMGQPIYQCADPTGYYDQAEAWLDSGVLTRRWDYALQMSRSSLKGVSVPGSFIGKYEKLESDKMKGQMVSDIIGADIGDRTKKLLDTYASHGTTSALGIVIGSPAFQQQ